MSDERTQQAAPWPLSSNWWLGIHSKPYPEHSAFNVIEITADGPDDFKKVIASIMVPKIDGLVCESHSFIGALIHQNTKHLASERDSLKADLEVCVSSISFAIKKIDANLDREGSSTVCVVADKLEEALSKLKYKKGEK